MQKESIVQQCGRVPVSCQEIYITIWYISLSSSIGPEAPTQGGMISLEHKSTWTLDRLETEGRFLEHHSVTSPPANQRKVTHPADGSLNFAYKTLPPKPSGNFGSFEHELPHCPCLALTIPFSAPNYDGPFPGGSHSKEFTCSAGDLGLIPGSRRSPGEGNEWFSSVQFSRSVVSDSATPWIAARQASLSITNS